MKYLMMTIGILTASIVQANAPKLYTKCDAEKYIRHPKNATRVYFSEDCTQAYVLPPKFSSLRINSANNYPDCSNYRNHTDAFLDYIKRLSAEKKQLEGKLNAQEESQTKKCKSERKKIEVKTAQLNKLKDELTKLNTDLNNKKESIKTCEAVQCRILNSQVATLDIEISILNKDIKLVESELSRINKTPNCHITNQSDEDVMQITALIKAKRDEISAETERYKRIIQEYSQEPGLIYNFQLEGRLQELVDTYNTLNRHLGVTFKAIKVEPTLHFNFKKPKSNSENSELHHVTPFYGVHSLEIPGIYLNKEDPKDGLKFGTTLSGQLTLNVPATCEAVSGNLKPENLIVANVGYKYDLIVDKSIEATINTDFFYQLITETKKSGGFFRKKHSTVIRETIRSKKSMDIKIENEYPGDKWSEDDWALAELVFNRMMQESLDFAGAKYEETDKNVGLNGAETLSKGLDKCPYKYCIAAKVVIDVSNAIFGTTTYSQNFTKTIGDNRTFYSTTSKAFEFWDTYTFEANK